MKKITLILFSALISIFIYSTSTVQAEELQHSVALHDRLIDFSDVQVIDNDTKVPLDEISKYLYLEPYTVNGNTVIKKYKKVFIYYASSENTYLDGKRINWSPIANVNGKLYISVKFLAKELGFNIKYFSNYKTLRISRDSYPSMSHKEFEKLLQSKIEKNKSSAYKANVYLTFDDGPNKYTVTNLDILKKYKVKATFFFLGNNMLGNEEIVQATADSGHYIGTHSMTHDKKKVYKDANAFINEIKAGTKLINEMTLMDAKLIRVPYGSVPHVTKSIKNEIKDAGYKLWDWDVDSNDWRYQDKEAQQIVRNVQEGINMSYKNGDKDIVVLLHDRSQTTIALPAIIEWIEKEGFLLKSYNPKEHVVQNFLKDSSL